MRAGQVTRPRHVEIVEADEPDVGEGECLLRLDYIGICGSDLRRRYRPALEPGAYPLPPGCPGHECLGTVVESRTADIAEGARALVHPRRAGGLQEYVAASPDRVAIVPVDGNPLRWLMCEPAATVLHALPRVPPLLGQRVAIIGQGAIGLIWTAFAYRMGAREVHCVDLEPARLELARRWGADSTARVDPARQDDEDAYGEAARYDVVVEAAGEPSAMAAALRLPRHEGFVVWFGTREEDAITIDYARMRRSELATVCTSPGVGPRVGAVMRDMVSLVQRSWIDLTDLVTHVVPFDQVDKAFVTADTRADRSIRVVLKL